MSESLNSIRQRARQKTSQAKAEHEARERSLIDLGQRLEAEASDAAQKRRSSIIRPLRVGLMLALLLLAAQISILFLSPSLIPKAKLWIDPPSELESQITLRQLRTHHPDMNETDLILVRGLENLAKEHDARLSELEASLKDLLKSASDRSDQDNGLKQQLDQLQKSVDGLTSAYNKLVEHYRKSMTSISERLDRLEAK